ncbi:ABC transporter substrate-binding protein [Pusillimonas noertemannii]|uniref:ABC transporter substrate-binding protein n=1 Tax=Pusillimonas noertemannii TaxID=305977 RepID=UPI00140250EB|nr:ABC transporter substrate-binding protein [Pusillimonas noertemannii]NYT68863.1 ABC transporter substrate-binding protein [Pusillimonas noertemannii]
MELFSQDDKQVPEFRSRRRFLSQIGCAAIFPFAAIAGKPAANGGEIIALNSAIAQSLLALGITRFGMPGVATYANTIIEPALPSSVFDIGSSTEPNLELLAASRPSMILYSPGSGPEPKRLREIAPIVAVPYYQPGMDHLDIAKNMLHSIAHITGTQTAEARYLEHLEWIFEQARKRTTLFQGRPLLGIDMAWARIFAVWGKGSPFDGVLRELGLSNAITDRDKAIGWKYMSFQQLLAMDDAWGINIGPLSKRTLNSPIWPMLPFVRNNRLISVPPSNQYIAGLPTIERLARTLGEALEAQS